MRQRISITDAAGRTVQAARFVIGYPYLVVTYTDETFSVIQAYEGYGCNPEIMDAAHFDMLEVDNGLLVEMGVASQNELSGLRRHRQSEREERERVEYERLKRKYSGEIE